MAVVKLLAELLSYAKVIIWFSERGVSLRQIKVFHYGQQYHDVSQPLLQ